MAAPRRPATLRKRTADYHRGTFLITSCTWGRLPVFGRIRSGMLVPTRAGQHAIECWSRIPHHFPMVTIHAVAVMPDHVHGILTMGTELGATHASPLQYDTPCHTPHLGTVIGSYKAAVARLVNVDRGTPGESVWQRGYHDRILRTPIEVEIARRYLASNPARWGG